MKNHQLQTSLLLFFIFSYNWKVFGFWTVAWTVCWNFLNQSINRENNWLINQLWKYLLILVAAPVENIRHCLTADVSSGFCKAMFPDRNDKNCNGHFKNTTWVRNKPENTGCMCVCVLFWNRIPVTWLIVYLWVRCVVKSLSRLLTCSFNSFMRRAIHSVTVSSDLDSRMFLRTSLCLSTRYTLPRWTAKWQVSQTIRELETGRAKERADPWTPLFCALLMMLPSPAWQL